MKKGVDKKTLIWDNSFGVCLAPQGYTSNSEKMYKVCIDGKVTIINERDIKIVYS